MPGSREITYDYLDNGLISKITDAAGNYILYEHDSEGNLTDKKIHDSAGVLARYSHFDHDAFNRLETAVYGSLTTQRFGYDDNNNLTNFTDGREKQTQYVYDALNRLKSMIRPGNTTTSYAYDANDNLTKITDPGSNETVYAYDDAGNLITTISPDTGTTSFSYDAAGNLTSFTNADNITVSYQYDAQNRLVSAGFPDASQNYAFEYDAGNYAKGRMSRETDPSGSISFDYNALGQITKITRITDGHAYATEYGYDAASADMISMTYPSGLCLTFSRDVNGRISGISAGNQVIADNIAYMPFGPVKNVKSGPVTISRAYNSRYLLTNIQAGTLMNLSYAYDGAGNVKTISGIARAPLSPGVTEYSHVAGRLTGIHWKKRTKLCL